MLLDYRSLIEAPAVPAVVETGSAAFPFVSPRLRRRLDIVPRRQPTIKEVEPVRRLVPIAFDVDLEIPSNDAEVIVALYAMGEITEEELVALLAA